MSEQGGGTGNTLVGIFLLVSGGCLLLVGGGCTILWLVLIFSAPGDLASGGAQLIVFIAMAAAGFVLIRAAFKAFRGPTPPAARAPQPDPPPLPPDPE